MPNMSRKSIRDMPDNGGEYVHKQTNTEYVLASQYKTTRRQLFGRTLNNNEAHLVNTSSWTTSILHVSILQRIVYSMFFVCWIASTPLLMAHSALVQSVRVLHRLASHLMMMDTWILRKQSKDIHNLQQQQERSKIVGLLALCSIPLLFLGGMWLLSTLGNALALVIASSSDILATAPIAGVGTAGRDTKSSELLIKIQLESPFRAGLSNVQLQQVAQSLKENVRLDLDVDSIIKILMDDPNVQRLDNSNAFDMVAELTKAQIASISNNLLYYQNENIDQVVQKVLESPSVQALMANYNSNSQIIEQDTLIKELQSQIDKLRLDLNAALLSNSAKFVQLTHSIKRCCRLNALQMEKYLHNLITAVLNSNEHRDNMAQWLGTIFVAQNELEKKLNNATEKLNKRFDDLIVLSAQKIMEDVSLILAGRVTQTDGSIPPDQLQIRAIVKQALATYDADKTGLVDYALESAGGQILSTRCTEHYSARTSVVSIFGVPLWYPSASPRTVITPGVVPGECWAFQSFPGFAIIKLSHNVTIDAFSYEHVSRNLIPSGRLDSAPKDFQVYGLQHEHDREPVLLGEYRYDANGDALQFFPVAEVQSRSFQIVELKVNSNHGNPNYTCLYRFRVHGKIATYF